MSAFSDTLRSWAEVFMRRSMHDFMRFSRASGLSMSQVNVLFHLRYGGSCGVTDIGEHLGISNAAASQLVDRLVNLGLLERSEDPGDRRAKHLTLTPRGEQVVRESIEARRRWMEDLTTALTPDQQQEIAAALSALTQAALELEAQAYPDPIERKEFEPATQKR